MSRDVRQKAVAKWCEDAFGGGHAKSIPQRGIRHLEESLETAQACGCDAETAHRLVDYVFSHEPGKLAQEIGQAGITLLALAEAAGLSAESEEQREYLRVLSKPLEHFKARNQVKNNAGFNVPAGAGGGK